MQLQQDEKAQKGEFVVMIQGEKAEPEQPDLDKVLKPLVAELGVKKGSQLAAEILGVKKNEAYQRALELKD